MAARRLLILMLVLLVTSTIAAALVPPQAEREQETTETTRPEPGDPDRERARAGRLIEATVEAEPGRPPRTIAIRLGDELELTVRSQAFDQVEIPALGRLAFVSPGSPARFYLFGERTGVFEVRLLEAERTIARIRVRETRRSSSSRSSSRR